MVIKINKKEIEMLQEQLVLLYKAIHQNKMAKSFYFKDLQTNEPSSEIINKLKELEDPEGTLKACIMELEQIKGKNNLDFNEIIKNYDIGFLKRKYYIKTDKDLDRLNIDELLNLLDD